jgi:hypothetical protein
VNLTDRASLYVARTVRLPLPLATESARRFRCGHDPVRAFGLPEGGRVHVELPFRRDDRHPLGRPELAAARTFGALYGPGGRRFCVIEVELAPWSRDVTELALRPAVRAPYRWSARRLARWFRLAHDTADLLRSELLAHSVVEAVLEKEAVAV